MNSKKPASQVSPFAAMTLGDQDVRWLSLHSQLLPYMTAVTAKEPPVAAGGRAAKEKTAAEKAAVEKTSISRKTPVPIPVQMPIFNAPPQPPIHGQYDAVLKRIDDASKQVMNWQDVNAVAAE